MFVDAKREVAELDNNGWDPRVRVFRVAGEVDVAAVVDRELVTLVDTAHTPEHAVAVMELLKPVLRERMLMVVNTHADYDHAWGNAAFRGPAAPYPAPILASRIAADRLRSPRERSGLADRQREDARFANVRLVPPTVELSGGDCIKGGDLSLEIIPTPGHTEDHIALWIPEIRTLLAGDAAENPFPCCDEGSSVVELVASLRLLRSLKPAVVIPCHGGVSDAALLSRNIAYFEQLESRIRALLDGRSTSVAMDARSFDADLIGYSYGDAIRDQGCNQLVVPAFYREWHRLAIRATAEALIADRA